MEASEFDPWKLVSSIVVVHLKICSFSLRKAALIQIVYHSKWSHDLQGHR